MEVRCWSKTGTGLRDFIEYCDECGIPEAAGQWDAGCYFIGDLLAHPIRAYHSPGDRERELRLFIGPPDPKSVAFVWSRTRGWRPEKRG